MYNLDLIFKKLPNELTIEDLNKIHMTVDYWQSAHKEAVKKVIDGATCLLVDAIGFYHEYNWRRAGYDKTPMEICFAVKSSFSYGAINSDAATEPDVSRNTKRVFRLTKRRKWDYMPIYQEQA